MPPDDLFAAADRNEKPKAKSAAKSTSNVPELSVSDLALSLKRTLEESYGHIRVRGEFSGLKLAASGHLYGDIKDENANINIICWRGTLSRLKIKPEDGMDVLVTGKVSSYPKSSRYQIIVESIELAGEGALLKLLEERKKKLAAEGLFDKERKKPLPFLPERIGIITSPTGAVIKDIMHRLRDRFPRHALLWPVKVQGDGADEQIVAAIKGFEALDPKPDILILARGGGSLEDLMTFNEENVVRAVADCSIPIITAVGHETDTTLVDYASDLRAPTPTGAAEMAVPVRLQIMAQIQDDHQRLIQSMARLIAESKSALENKVLKIGNPQNLIETKLQDIDILSEKLSIGLQKFVLTKKSVLSGTAAKLTSPKSLILQKRQNIEYVSKQFSQNFSLKIKTNQQKLASYERILQSLSPKSILNRGFAIVYDSDGKLLKNSHSVGEGQDISIEFANEDKLDATVKKK
ncbi:MAG: exodeoxyribonuclease VII large subunit [Pseudomonadota bacterium]